MTGRLGRFALGMMKKKAQSLGDEFAANLQRALADAAPAPVDAPAPVAASAPITTPVVATIAAPPRSWWSRLLQWLRARLGRASPHHP